MVRVRISRRGAPQERYTYDGSNASAEFPGAAAKVRNVSVVLAQRLAANQFAEIRNSRNQIQQ